MKDYYYILGVNRTASLEELTHAYRKLSIKFHPDKNDGDKFFEDRFKEINEAYGILSDISRRQKYDEAVGATKKYAKYAQQDSSQKRPSDSPPKGAPPSIIYFTADKSSITLGEVITFSWATQNANLVVLKPFGQVANVGNKTVKPFGFNESTGLKVELRAINELTGEVSESKIFITKRIVTESKITNNIRSDGKVKTPRNRSIMVFWMMFFFLCMVISTVLTSEQEELKTQSTTITMSGDSSAIVTPKNNLPGLPVTPLQNVPIPSQWKDNQLRDGSSPFNNCFGKGQRNGSSWVLFKNKNSVDAIVCLINVATGRTIRNEYIRAGSNFKMSNVPSGNYTLKVLFGNDWNPTLKSPCGSLGFFESDVSFSASDGYNDTINVDTINDGYSVTYSTHTITLYPVTDGNMSQRDIDASQFFGQ